MKPRRPWPLAITIALSALYVPTLVPFVTGALTGPGHTMGTYACLLPVAPMWLVGLLVTSPFGASNDTALHIGGGGVTLVMAAGMMTAARCLRSRDLLATCIVVMPLIGIQAHLLSVMLAA